MSRALLIVDFEVLDNKAQPRVINDVATLLTSLEKAKAVDLGRVEVTLHTGPARDTILETVNARPKVVPIRGVKK